MKRVWEVATYEAYEGVTVHAICSTKEIAEAVRDTLDEPDSEVNQVRIVTEMPEKIKHYTAIVNITDRDDLPKVIEHESWNYNVGDLGTTSEHPGSFRGRGKSIKVWTNGRVWAYARTEAEAIKLATDRAEALLGMEGELTL